MNILEKIVASKKKEIEKSKDYTTIKSLEESIFYSSPVVSLSKYLKRPDKVGIIAEIKRSSPSNKSFSKDIDVEQLSIAYMQSGASALSILTDKTYFEGTTQDLEIARKFNYCPILRKDFVLDEYQVIESKSIGADCILLIAACLTPQRTQKLAAFAKSIGLEILLEVHNKEEIQSHVNEHIDLIGVNNRNLKTFDISITNSLELMEHLPSELVKVSESGISKSTDIKQLSDAGFDGFLIGTHFMKSSYPAQECKKLIDSYNLIRHEN